MSSKTRDHTVVVAIGFGTTYSGYAFSLRSDFLKAKDNCLNQITTDNWNSGNLLSEKLVSLGYEAENKYSTMANEERDEHYYFRRFKMTLYDKDGTLVSLIQHTKY